MKKILVGMIMLLSLSLVGCSSTDPTEEEMKEYFDSERNYFKVVTDSLSYDELKNIANERNKIVEGIDLKNIEKYFKFKEYVNLDESVVKELRKYDFKDVKIKTNKLKENVKLYNEIAELMKDGNMSDEELETKESLVTKIDINFNIITGIGLPQNMD